MSEEIKETEGSEEVVAPTEEIEMATSEGNEEEEETVVEDVVSEEETSVAEEDEAVADVEEDEEETAEPIEEVNEEETAEEEVVVEEVVEAYEDEPKPVAMDEGAQRGGFVKPVQEGDIVETEILSVGEKGDGIAKVKGFVVFVAGGTVGQKVKLKISRVLRRFAIGEIVE